MLKGIENRSQQKITPVTTPLNKFRAALTQKGYLKCTPPSAPRSRLGNHMPGKHVQKADQPDSTPLLTSAGYKRKILTLRGLLNEDHALAEEPESGLQKLELDTSDLRFLPSTALAKGSRKTNQNFGPQHLS